MTHIPTSLMMGALLTHPRMADAQPETTTTPTEAPTAEVTEEPDSTPEIMPGTAQQIQFYSYAGSTDCDAGNSLPPASITKTSYTGGCNVVSPTSSIKITCDGAFVKVQDYTDGLCTDGAEDGAEKTSVIGRCNADGANSFQYFGCPCPSAYKVFTVESTTFKTYDDAASTCESVRGRRTMELRDADAVAKYLATTDRVSSFMGLKRDSTEFLWESDSVELSYSNWLAGHPGTSDCVRVDFTSGLWNTFPCNRGLPVMCETCEVGDDVSVPGAPGALQPHPAGSCEAAGMTKRYKHVSATPLGFVDAQNFCSTTAYSADHSIAGSLATILNSKEQERFNADIADQSVTSGTSAWIAGKYQLSNFEIEWEYITSPHEGLRPIYWGNGFLDVRYGNWVSFPSGATLDANACVAAQIDRSANAWSIDTCSTTQSFVCEYCLPISDADCVDTCFGKAAGVYTVAGVEKVYCDGDGRALIQNNLFNSCPTGAYAENPSLTLDSCGYHSASDVQKLAALSTGVALSDAGHGSVSGGSNAVQALVDGTNWQSLTAADWGADSNADWKFGNSCTASSPGVATSWPNMIDTCNQPSHVNWVLTGDNHARNGQLRGTQSSTWLQMTALEQCACPDTCYGKAAGTYTILGVNNVYCDGTGNALVQHYTAACGATYGEVASVSNISTDCGYLSERKVRALAAYAYGVTLQSEGAGEVRNSDAVMPLRYGGNWMNVDFGNSEANSGWCFTQTGCEPIGVGLTGKWPNVYHSCNSRNCMHWLDTPAYNHIHSNTHQAPAVSSHTWLQMDQPAPGCETPTMTLLPPVTEDDISCDETCAGKLPGFHVVRGINVYCDGNARALLANSNNNCGTDAFGVLESVSLSSCGYLSETQVRHLASRGNGVELEDEGFGSVTAGQVALDALLSGGNWNGVSWSSNADWCFTRTSCDNNGNGLATGWPNMIHSCNERDCTHWLDASIHVHSRTAFRPTVRASTWLKMFEPAACPTPTCADTCVGQADGKRTIAGIANVHCEGGRALIQNLAPSCVNSYGVVSELEATGCGYLSPVAVKDLARFGTTMVLQEEGAGEIVSDSTAVAQLLSGGNWQQVQWSVNSAWCFAQTDCNNNGNGLATGWPQMIHSCNEASCTHWLDDNNHLHGRTAAVPTVRTSTWMNMVDLGPQCAPSPTDLQGAATCDDSCFGKAPGLYTIAGVENVFCEGGYALIQNMLGDCDAATYGPEVSIGRGSCGYRTAGDVEKLALFSTEVKLEDTERGSVTSQGAVSKLVAGGNWQTGVAWTGNSSWCFPTAAELLAACNNGGQGLASKWPDMYHACGQRECTHWLHESVHVHSVTAFKPETQTSTWLKMLEKNECRGTSCAETCSGRPEGFYNIAGSPSVFCKDGRALIQNRVKDCSNYQPLATVDDDACGLMVPYCVELLSKHTMSVVVQNDGGAFVDAGSDAVESLLNGGSLTSENPAVQSSVWMVMNEAVEVPCPTGPTTDPTGPTPVQNPSAPLLVPTIAEPSIQDPTVAVDPTVPTLPTTPAPTASPTGAPTEQDPTVPVDPTTPTTPVLPTASPTAAQESTAQPTAQVPTVPVTPTGVPCSEVCTGRSQSTTHTVAGVAGVICRDGAALIQSSLRDCDASQYGELSQVSMSSCGYLSEADVRKLAQHGVAVQLEDADRGIVQTGQVAVDALLNGGNWQQVQWSANANFCFTQINCANNGNGFANGWPNMIHSCDAPQCVHWLAAVGLMHSPTSSGVPVTQSTTWIQHAAQCTA